MNRTPVKALCGLVGLTFLILPPTVQGQTVSEIEILKQEIDEQKNLIKKLEARLNTLAAQQDSQQKSIETTAAKPPNVGYDHGFFIRDDSGDNSLSINGLIQPRFKYFETSGTSKFAAKDQGANTFDIFLGRLYFSGNVIDPSVRFWLSLHGTTVANGYGLSLLDAEISKTFDPLLTVEVGRYWSAYSFGYWADPSKFLLPDMSAAEWAFSLGRQVGMRFSGQNGKWAYKLSVSNSIPGSDVANTENLHGDLAVIGNVQYDILAPYGTQETDPNPEPVRKPQLSLWASSYYNPVEYSSVFENDVAGDKNYGATSSINFRYGYFSFQGSGYYKDSLQRTGALAHPEFSSHGWSEQSGLYLIPGKVELAERIDGIIWGRGQIPITGGSENQWYAGPANFSYHKLTEFTGGLNYYLHGHDLKAQFAYSYMAGRGFNGQTFDANRFLFQTQLAF